MLLWLQSSDDDSDVNDEEVAKELQQKMNDETKRTRGGKSKVS